MHHFRNKAQSFFQASTEGPNGGGAADDPDGIMYLNSSEMPWIISLDTATEKKVVHPGEKLYLSTCATCHGKERKGNPASGYPSLVTMTKYKRAQVFTVIGAGKGMMPAFKGLTDEQKNQIVAFLYGDKIEIKEDKKEVASKPKKDNYKISGYIKFLDKDGYPAVKPPWGTLNAIDLNTGEYVWKKTFGEVPELEAKGITDTGSDSYGGPVVTASGLLFIAGGILTLGSTALVHALTLPTELNASFARALPSLERGRYLIEGDLPHARRLLNAAAWTYVAASLMTLLNMARWLAILRR